MTTSPALMRRLTYGAVFLLSLHLALPAYINSTYLAERVGAELVGFVFTFAALAALLSVYLLPRIISRNGLLNVVALFGIINIFLAIMLVNAASIVVTTLFFIAFFTFGILLRFGLDIYLEQISPNGMTGRIRGLFLTLMNFGWLCSPWLAAQAAAAGDLRSVYLIAGLLLIPFTVITLFALREREAVPYPRFRPHELLAKLWRGRTAHYRNLYNILAIDLFLNIFYAIMVVYMPLYLHNYIGLSWPQIGIIFSWMLLPFVLLDYPLGLLADKKLGEKEILVTGLVVVGVFTALLPLITSSTIFIWAVALFMTRVGASMVEVMKETYLFKQIDAGDTQVVMMSRLTAPLALLIGPAVVAVTLPFTAFSNIFIGLGVLVLSALYFAFALQDTK
jgi:MFS family permease